jgi:23S rRNA (adenine2503-C2)-methyltransferase
VESIYSMNRIELNHFFASRGHSPLFTDFIYEDIYKDLMEEEVDLNLLSLKAQEDIRQSFDFELPTIKTAHESQDGTVKFLIQFKDGATVETVLIPFFKKYTVCLSTQVGCAMNCQFCFTATQGLQRNLRTEEIIGQYIKAWQYLKLQRPNQAVKPNVVFMGQGEPLHNFDELKKALEIMTDQKALELGPRQITLSTVGFLPGLQRWSELPSINLALSLHSPFEEERRKLIPINAKYPLKDVLDTLNQVPLKKRQFITLEYLLIKGFNDSETHAKELSKVLPKNKVIINIIPFNPWPGSQFQRPEVERVDQFKQFLVERKMRTMIRTTKGDDILAACGQLKSKDNE